MSWRAVLAAAAGPISPGQLPEEDVAGRVVAEGEPSAVTVGGRVVPGRLDNFAALDEVRAFHPADGDLNPVADAELHHPVVTARESFSYANVRCGICGECVGCECDRLQWSEVVAQTRVIAWKCECGVIAWQSYCQMCGRDRP